MSKKKFYQINQYIKADKLRVVDDEGGQLDVLTRDEALKIAKDKGLDLVLVAPSAKPPVAKLINFNNFKYQQKKKAQSGRKKAKTGEIKEIRLTPFIAENDLNTRIKKAKDFLLDGNRVKINVKFVGRQITRKEFGHELVDKVTEQLGEIALVDQKPKFQGKILTASYKPSSKAKQIAKQQQKQN